MGYSNFSFEHTLWLIAKSQDQKEIVLYSEYTEILK